MKTFADTAGQLWTVSVTVRTIKRVRALAHVDLLELVEENSTLLSRLITDPVLLAEVLCAVCYDQIEERGITADDFLDRLAGDPIDQATKAILEDIADFFSNPRDRAQFHRILRKTWEAMDKARDLVEDRTRDELIDEAVASALRTSENLSGNAPESSGSTPTPSPSGSCSP